MNQCTITGNLGAEPEIKSMPSGNRVCNLNIAVTDKWRDKSTGEQKEHTEWIPVTIWQEGLIGVCEKHLHKGSKVLIQGKFSTRKWQDQGGNDRYSTSIVLQGFGGVLEMLGGGNKQQSNNVSDNQQSDPYGADDPMGNDTPF